MAYHSKGLIKHTVKKTATYYKVELIFWYINSIVMKELHNTYSYARI